jgi:hypothetical protein
MFYLARPDTGFNLAALHVEKVSVKTVQAALLSDVMQAYWQLLWLSVSCAVYISAMPYSHGYSDQLLAIDSTQACFNRRAIV